MPTRQSKARRRHFKQTRRRRSHAELLERRDLLAASLSIGDAMVDEGNPGGAPAELKFPITRGGDTSQELEIAFEIFAASDDLPTDDERGAAQRGLAAAGGEGADFVLPSFQTITIPAGSVGETLTITVNPDVAVEGDERLEVRFTSVVGEVTFASDEDTRATGTILNDDQPNELLDFLTNLDTEERDRLIGQIKDGFDDTFEEIIAGIETAVDEISDVPIVGGQLADAVEPVLSGIEDIAADLSALVETVFTSSSENLIADFQNAMFEILEPVLLDSPDAGTEISASDILLSYGADDLDGPAGEGDGNPDPGTSWVQFDFHLGQREIKDLPFEFDLGAAAALPGLDALGLSVDASDGLRFDLQWNLRYGFGLSQRYGIDPNFDLDYFYVNSGAVDVTGTPVEEFRASIDIKSAPAQDEDGFDVLSGDAGLKAEATIGLLAAKVEDGIPFAVDITAERGFDFGGNETEANFTLVIDAGGDAPVEVDISGIELPTSADDDLESALENLGTFLIDLQGELVTALEGKFNDVETTGGDGQTAFAPVTVSLDFGSINGFANPDLPTTPSIVLSAELPQISSMTIIGGGELGFAESNLGSLTDPGPFGQFDDGRSAAVGFDATDFEELDDDGLTTVSSEISSGRYQLRAGAAAPASGLLRQDTEFVLVLNNAQGADAEERILISIGEEQNRDIKSLRDQLNTKSLESVFRDTINQAISQQQKNNAYETIDVEVDDDGFFVLTSRGDADNSGPTLDIDYGLTDQSKISVVFTVDIDDPNWTLFNQRQNPNDQAFLDRVTRGEIQDAKKITDRFQPEAEASVALKLHATADLNALIDEAGDSIPSVPLINEGLLLPKIDFDFVFDASASAKFKNPKTPDPDDDEAGEKRFTNELETLRFENVSIDIGTLLETFVEPIANFVGTAFGPVSTFVGGLSGNSFLDKNLPVLKDIPGNDFKSLLDLASRGNRRQINQFRNALGSVNGIAQAVEKLLQDFDGQAIAMGCFEYFKPEGADSRALLPCSAASAIDSATSTEAGQFINAYEQATSTAGGLRFDFLFPTNLVSLLRGENADLVSLNVPALNLTVGKDIGLDIGIAEADISAEATINTQLGLVYDSIGLSKIVDAFRGGDDANWDDLLDGLYVRAGDGKAVDLDVDLDGKVKVDVEVASGSVKANLSGGVDVDILDPNEDGALRLDEIQSVTGGDTSKVFCLVDASASLNGEIDVKLEALGKSVSLSDIPGAKNITQVDVNLNIKRGLFKDLLEDAGFDLDCLDDVNPILALPRIENGEDVIRIHTGPYARDRREGDVSDEDGPAVITVEENNDDSITVFGFGGETTVPFKSENPPLIVITGGPNGDVFDLSDVESLPIRMEGAGGGDTLFGGDQADEIYGGDGGDFIDPGRGDDMVVTGRGSNLVVSSPGADTVDAGANTDSRGFIYGYDLNASGGLKLNDQGEPIPRPDRNVGDTVIGSDMDDFLVGTNVDGGKGEDTIRGAGTGGTLDGGEDDDIITGGDGDETLLGGPGEDRLEGGPGADSLLGGDDDDELIAGYGDLLASGGGGNDEMTVDLGIEIVGLGISGINTSLGLGNYTAESINDSSASGNPFPSKTTSYAGIEKVTNYQLGDGDDTVKIDGVGAELNIATLAGDDTVTWIGNSAEVELDAGDDDDELVIDRSGQSAPIDATIQSTRLSGFADAALILNGSSLEQITVTLGSGSDRIRLDAPAAETTIEGANGDRVIVERLVNPSTITAEQVTLELDSDAGGLRNEFGDADRLNATVDKLIVDNRENTNALDFSLKDREVLVAGLAGPLIENTAGIGLIEFLGTTVASTQDTLKVIDTAESSKTFRIEDRLVEVIQGGDVLQPAARSPEVILDYPFTPRLDGPFHVLFPGGPDPRAPGNPDKHVYVIDSTRISIFDVVRSPSYELLPAGSVDAPFNVNVRSKAVFDPSGRFLYISRNLANSGVSEIAVYSRDIVTGQLSLLEIIDSFPAGNQPAPIGFPQITDMEVAEETVYLTIYDSEAANEKSSRVYLFDRERLSSGTDTGKLVNGRYVPGVMPGIPIDAVWDAGSKNYYVVNGVGARLQLFNLPVDPNDDSRLLPPISNYMKPRIAYGEELLLQPVRNNSPRKVYLVENSQIIVLSRNGAADNLIPVQDVFLPAADNEANTLLPTNDLEFNADGTRVSINNDAELRTYALALDGLFLDKESMTPSKVDAVPIDSSNSASVINFPDNDSLARDPRGGRFLAPTADNQITVFSSSLDALQLITDGATPTFDASSLRKLVYSDGQPRSAYGISADGFLVEFERSTDGDPLSDPKSILTPDDWEFDRLRDKGLEFAADLVLAEDKHLYVAVTNRTSAGGAIKLYQRDPATGDLTFDPTIKGNANFNGVRTLQLSPDEGTLWAASAGTVRPYTRDKATGYLTPETGTAALRDTREFAIDPDSDFIFLALGGSSGGIATRLQSNVANEPAAHFELLPGATSVKLIGDQLYAGTSDGLLKVYSIDASGKLTLLQTASGGTGGAGSLADVVDIAASDDERYVFAGSAEGVIVSYRRDQSTGRLSFSQRTAEGILDVEGIVGMTSMTFAASENEDVPDLLYVTSPNGWTAIEITPSDLVQTSSYRVGFDGNFRSLDVASDDSEPGGGFSDIVSSTGVSNIPLTIKTFGGGDDVSIAGQPGNLTLYTGSGNDFVRLRSVSGEKTSLELGDGDDTIEVNLPGLAISGDDAIVSINGDSPLFDNNPPLGDTLTYIVGGLNFDADPATQLNAPEGQISVDGQVIVKWEEIESLGDLADLSASITVTPESIEEGNSVDLTATASAEGVTVSESDYQWDLDGDGVFGDRIGSMVSLDWPALQALGIDDDGDYPVAVEVITSGLRAIATASITVTNADPVLSASVNPETIDQFESVSLTLGSTDPGDDTIERWEVDWDSDGTVDDTYFIDAGVVNHVYDQSGTQTITATAYDEDGGPYAAATATVVVNEIPPRVRSFEGTTIMNEGGTGNYSLIATGGTTTPVSWLVDFGDGTIKEITSTEFTHTYVDDGTYTLSAVVLEDDGSSLPATDTLTVQVNPVDPTIVTERGVSPIDEGQVYTLGVAAIDDPGDDAITDWMIDWGDGTVQTIIGDIRSAAHRYLDDSAAEPGGVYEITVWATDEDGTYPGPAPIPVEVANVAVPMISVPDSFSSTTNFDFTVAEGQPLELILTNDDPGQDTTTEWIIDWDGDGPMTPVSYPSDPEAPLRNVSFVYNAEIAPLQITAVMIDEDGEHPTNTLTGEVTNTPPTPRIRGGSTTAVEGSPFFVTLDPGTEGTNTQIVRWRIEWNDGTGSETITLDEPSTTVTLSHVFPDGDGSAITVNAFAIDEADQEYPAALTVPVLNQPPTIAISGPASVEENTEYLLTLGPVIDPAIVDTVTRYVIHWGDGSSTQLTPQEVSDLGGVVHHLYLDDPPFAGNVDTIINVDLVDEDGRTPNAGSTRVRIVNVAPVADAGGPYEILIPATEVTLNASANDQSPQDTFTFDWDLDDDGVFGDATGPNPIFDATGAFPGQVFNIALCVTDDDGGVSEIVTTTVRYLSIPEIDSITLDETSINENDLAELTVDFSDTDPNQTHTVTVDWGDGSGPTVQTLPVGDRSVTLTHPYLDDDPTGTPADPYTIDVIVANTAAEDTGSTGITVSNVVPEVFEFASDALSLESKSDDLEVTVSGIVGDVGSLDTHTAVIDWGDRSDPETIDVSEETRDFAALHHYPGPGIYEITVTVTDDDGGVSDTVTTAAVIQGVGLVDGTLFLIGTDGRDHVNLHYKEKKDELDVNVKFNQGEDQEHVQATFQASSIERIVAFLCGGDDHYHGKIDAEKDSSISIRQIVFGGDGRDKLHGGDTTDALLGGPGKDDIKGRDGNDLLIGGQGKDKIHGDDGDDLLIGDAIGASESAVATIGKVDSALQSWIDGDPDGVVDSLEGIIDDGDDDRLHDRKGTNEFVEGSSGQAWVWWVDVDGNGRSTALDALMIINRLSRGQNGEGEIGKLYSDDDLYDINLDGRVSSLDALQVINELTRRNHMPQKVDSMLASSTEQWQRQIDSVMTEADEDDRPAHLLGSSMSF